MADNHDDRLRQIAALLGVSVEALGRGPRPGDFHDATTELLTLWFAIEDAAERLKILETAREAVRSQTRDADPDD